MERADDPRHGACRARLRAGRTGWRPRAARSSSSGARCGSDGRLLATYKDGRAHLDAYLDDYAFLIAALLELLQADSRSPICTWRAAGRRAARPNSRTAPTAASSSPARATKKLFHRPKPGQDNATPAGNAVAAGASAACRLPHRRNALRRRPERTQWPFSARRCATIRRASAPWPSRSRSRLRPPQRDRASRPGEDRHAWRGSWRGIPAATTRARRLPDAPGCRRARQAGSPEPVNAWLCEGVIARRRSSDLDTIRRPHFRRPP